MNHSLPFSIYHSLNSVPPKIHVETQRNPIRKWGHWEVLGHEAEALMNEISVLMKEIQKTSLASFSCKLKEEITRYSTDFAFDQYMYGIYKRLYLKQIGVKCWDDVCMCFVSVSCES